MIKYLILTIISITLLFGCKTSNYKQLSKGDKILIQSCLKDMETETFGMNKSYLITPFFDEFSFDDYTEKSKTKAINLLNWTESEFILEKKETNSKYDGRTEDLLHFSKGTESNIVITFSKLHKELVLVRWLYYNKPIRLNSMHLDESKAKIHQKDLLLFIFESGVIKQVILDGNSFIKEL